MDWYCWLSKTNLELSLIHEYGLAFTRNELKEDDISHFNHEFLQSMGISVAKHRLEILKLARKQETGRSPNGFSKLVSAISKTRKLFSKNISQWNPCKHSSAPMPLSELTPCRTQRGGVLRRIDGSAKEHNDYDKAAPVTRRCGMRSGPLDRRAQQNSKVTNRILSASGPLDIKVKERFIWNNWIPEPARLTNQKRPPNACRGATMSGPLRLSSTANHHNEEKTSGAYDEVHSVWSMMFKDMKPT